MSAIGWNNALEANMAIWKSPVTTLG